MKVTLKGVEKLVDGPFMVCIITDGITEAEIMIAIEGGGPVKYKPLGAVGQTITSWLETHTLREVLEAVPEAARAEALDTLRQFYQREGQREGAG